MRPRQPQPITKSALARLDGRHKSQVTRACQHDGPLADAMLSDGRIDLGHPDTIAWRQAADDAPTGYQKPAGSEPTDPTDPSAPGDSDAPAWTSDRYPPPPKLDERGYADELAEFTLAEIVKRYGTVQGYSDILGAHERRERARKTRLDNEQTEGELIPWQLVATHVFGAMEAGNRRLLTDFPKTIARKLYAMARSDAPIEEAEATVREMVTSLLTPVKRTVARILRDNGPGRGG